MEAASVVIAGLGFGLASALHCAAMCGSIICGAALATVANGDQRNSMLSLAALHAGRVVSYAALGALAALSVSGLMTAARYANPEVFRFAAAFALIWAGMSIAGLMPRLAFADTAMAGAASRMATLTRRMPHGSMLATGALGMLWGLNACPMLYGAVFAASLSGSPLNGAVFMIAFGLGTIPAVVAGSIGIRKLATLRNGAVARGLTGALIAGIGVASFVLTDPKTGWLCLTPAS